MIQRLTDMFQTYKNKQYAIKNGTENHSKMQHIVIDLENGDRGDKYIISTIKSHPDLVRFFTPDAQTEVHIAGTLHGHFISRRVDRLVLNHNTKTIDFIDYKTDIDKSIFLERYKYQIKEYKELLQSAYDGYKINGYILWLHDWTIDKIIS